MNDDFIRKKNNILLHSFRYIHIYICISVCGYVCMCVAQTLFAVGSRTDYAGYVMLFRLLDTHTQQQHAGSA